MLNLRFISVVIKSSLYSFRALLRADYMIHNKDNYSDNERYEYARQIMNKMRRCSRTTTKAFGKENIPIDETCIFYSNHQGKYDALGILLELEKPCSVLWEKKQAKKIMGKQVCELIDGVAIDLTDIRDIVRSIANVTERVRNGRNFLIFPEGGYEADTHNTLQDFKSGCFSCSLKSKTTIVPVAIYDSYKAMNSNTFEKVTTQVHFLKPIPFCEYGHMNKNQICEMVKNRIQEKMSALESM